MLSRFVLNSALCKQSALLGLSRSVSYLPTDDRNPERDLKNFPRPVRRIEPEPVRHAFIPERWFQFLQPRLGVTGPYTFGVGLITYLLSKEIWVTDHDFGYVMGSIIIITFIQKKFGKEIAQVLDKFGDEEEKELLEGRHSKLSNLEESIADEKWNQERALAQSVLFDARKENIHLQLEAIYRERALLAYQQVKNRLEYQATLESIQRRISQKNIVQWVSSHVLKSITPDQDKHTVKKCISDLKSLAASA